MTSMRILVSGGFGFIGSHVLRQLVDEGHEVGCFDLAKSSPVAAPVLDHVMVYRGDVTDPVEVFSAIAAFEPDRIIHLASLLGRESQADPRMAIRINVLGTIHVLEAAIALGVERVVAASSASTYGTVSQELDHLDEDVPQSPESMYGLSKYVVERVGGMYRDQHGIEFAVLQPVHGLGPDRHRGNVEDAFIIKAAVSNVPITVPDVDYPFEAVAVMDEASAFITVALADEVPHDRYIIGSGEQMTLVELVDMITTIRPDVQLEIGAPRGDDHLFQRPASDPHRMADDFGWTPTYSIAEAVEAYIDWLEANPDSWTFDVDDIPWDAT